MRPSERQKLERRVIPLDVKTAQRVGATWHEKLVRLHPTRTKDPAMDNSIHQQTIQLTGARRDFTGKLKSYDVQDGRIVLVGHAQDVLAWARDIEINFAGFPLGDPRIERTERAIAAAHGGQDESQVQPERHDADRQAQVHGAGVDRVPGAAAAAAVGGQHDDAPAGRADAGATGGNGQPPVVNASSVKLPELGAPNPKLVKALDKLEDGNDAHWTAGGLPKIEAVTKISGLQGLTRAMIESASPRRRAAQPIV